LIAAIVNAHRVQSEQKLPVKAAKHQAGVRARGREARPA
jgi:hypothetical protein